MEQNTTSQAAQKQGVKKKKSIKQKLLAFLKLAAPYLILCAIYGTLMLIFGPKESNSMELSIDVGTSRCRVSELLAGLFLWAASFFCYVSSFCYA